ncbi:LOW QUALITY PROTEIN: protein PHYTOCHROME KINASE SUBSTRATE 1 [Salvia miltiorrhiza]|uniref:LOW QUALITY PROTEIN: protein PHYTOCHROME KINASE SUBSTRATE 1 n=1 Tax=Salvia miltiorrhiza TaxID=226208 RepID=UPI0025ABCD48|nr:LOW QUALITY PROTEIN: protein PHYTOCHROME KINASE SUBSTRATE 1 [Salvia miltiorrhiza]
MSMPVTTLTPPSKQPSQIMKNSTSREGLTTTHDRIFLGKNASGDKEIDVFDARKYFNEGLNHTPKICTKIVPNHHHDDHQQQPQLKKDVQTAVKEPPSAALSIRSQSSWNSRSALIRTASGRQQQLSKKSFLGSIGCNCSCLSSSIIGGRSKPDNKTSDHHFIKREKQEREREITFTAANPHKREQVFNMDTNLTMLTWDAITPLSVAEELKIPSISSEMHEDSNSDASSDLFEIESLYMDNPFDPTTCYAPSEASIEWSVVTASAADFSLLSDSDDVSSTIQRKSGFNSKTASMPKIRPSILSGCKSQKAVSVAGDAQTRRPLTPMTRFHDENKLSFDAKSRQSSLDHRVMPQPRSAMYT